MNVWTDYLPRVLPYVNGCPDDLALQAIHDTAIDFCRRTGAWAVELAQIPTVGGQSDYTLASYLPTNPAAQIVKLLRFYVGAAGSTTLLDDSYRVVSPEIGRKVIRGWSYDRVGWISEDKSTFSVYPTPTDANSYLLLYVSLKPSQAGTGVPSQFFEDYVDDIKAGALARLMNIPNTKWRDPAEAMVQQTSYNDRVGIAANAVSDGLARSSSRTRGFFF